MSLGGGLTPVFTPDVTLVLPELRPNEIKVFSVLEYFPPEYYYSAPGYTTSYTRSVTVGLTTKTKP